MTAAWASRQAYQGSVEDGNTGYLVRIVLSLLCVPRHLSIIILLISMSVSVCDWVSMGVQRRVYVACMRSSVDIK